MMALLDVQDVLGTKQLFRATESFGLGSLDKLDYKSLHCTITVSVFKQRSMKMFAKNSKRKIYTFTTQPRVSI